MLVPFLIMFREGVEAALIVGIIASYLHQTGRSAWMPVVWIGVLLATAMSLAVGAILQLLSAEFPQKAQELFEAIIGLIAVFVLTSMVFWMRKAARSIKAELHHSIDAAFETPTHKGFGLILMVFFAVAREGLSQSSSCSPHSSRARVALHRLVHCSVFCLPLWLVTASIVVA